MRNFLVAWLASTVAFSIAFVCFMIFWNWLDQNPPTWGMIHRLAWVTVGGALVVQFFYGGLIYFLLNRIRLWRLWTVTLAYLLLWVIAWSGIDTFREAWGMLAWLALACLVAWVFWFFALDRNSSPAA
jgi:hypothetical protein